MPPLLSKEVYNLIITQNNVKGKRKGGIHTAYIKKTNNPRMGRPSQNLTHIIRIRIDDDLNAKLAEYANNRNITKSTAIREILTLFFNND